jgi:hypothetical protein
MRRNQGQTLQRWRDAQVPLPLPVFRAGRGRICSRLPKVKSETGIFDSAGRANASIFRQKPVSNAQKPLTASRIFTVIAQGRFRAKFEISSAGAIVGQVASFD